jgi:hypothetical protein
MKAIGTPSQSPLLFDTSNVFELPRGRSQRSLVPPLLLPDLFARREIHDHQQRAARLGRTSDRPPSPNRLQNRCSRHDVLSTRAPLGARIMTRSGMHGARYP